MTMFRKNLEYKDVRAIEQDTEYKISRPGPEEKLEHSISVSGILQPVILFQDGDSYRVLVGHNRIAAALDQQLVLPALVCDAFEIDVFVEQLLLKNYYNEIGPLGKVKAFTVLMRHCAEQEKPAMIELCRTVLRMPDFILNSKDTVSYLLALPQPLQRYLDSKDIQYKIIKKMLQLPKEGISILSAWLETITMRVNIFKEVVQSMADIYTRDETFARIAAINSDELPPREREAYVYRQLQNIRYPKYTEIKDRSLALEKEFRSNGVEVQFPAYFEGSSVAVTISVKKSDKGKSFFEALQMCNKKNIERLLDIV